MQPVAPRHPEASVKRAASFVLLTIYALLTLGCGNSSSNGMLNNPASPQVRVVQGAADVGSVDALVNGVKVQTSSNPLGTPPYFAVNGTSVHFEEVPAGAMGPAMLAATYPVAANSFNTVMVVGEEANGSLASIALVDDHSAPAPGQVKLRVVHGSGTIGPVDFYIHNVGSPFPTTPTISNLPFKSATAYLPLSAVNFHVCMMPAGIAPASGLVGLVPRIA
jgi:hypothetical protein